MKKSQVLCKVCGISDFQTAQFCAEAGADFIGLHAIWRIKPENLTALEQIAQTLPKIYRHINIVLVTRQENISSVVEMVETIRPSHVQLHSPWSGDSISEVRRALEKAGCGDTRLIGVVALKTERLERVSEVSHRVDLLLLDSLPEGGSGQILDTTLLRNAMKLSRPTPVLIAGGLTPENVKHYVEALHPFGVDVQTGVEYPNKPGVKDPDHIVAFLRAAKG